MSLRRFNGWEPEQVHTHYDAEGQITGRTVVTVEPEWDDEQRNLALEILSYESKLCPGCGGHMSHSFDPEVGRDVQHRHARCLDCKAIEEVRAAHHKSAGHTDDRCDCNEFMTWVDAYVPLRRNSDV